MAAQATARVGFLADDDAHCDRRREPHAWASRDHRRRLLRRFLARLAGWLAQFLGKDNYRPARRAGCRLVRRPAHGPLGAGVRVAAHDIRLRRPATGCGRTLVTTTFIISSPPGWT